MRKLRANMRKLRASSLPMVNRCPGFTSKPFDTKNTKAGTDRHEALEEAIKNGNRSKLNALPEDDKDGVIFAENHILLNTTSEFPMEWESGKGIEVICDDVKITGRWDLINGRQGFDLKWRLPGEGKSYLEQAAFYAYIIMERDNLNSFKYSLIYGQPKVVKVIDFTKEQAKKIIEDVVANSKKNDVKPNAYCSWCALSDGRCDAIRSTALVVSDDYREELEKFKANELSDPIQLNRALLFIRNLKPFIDEIERMGREYAIEKGGALNNFRVTERAKKTEVTDLNAAFNASGLSSSDFMDCCSITLTKLYDKWASVHDVSKTEAKREIQVRLADVFAPKQTIKCLTKIK